jgi:aspartate carbamoyltransferase catalytic subunit
MLQSLTTDLIVLRHSQAGAPYALMRHFHGAVINAGDGCHAHPSQALINLFTIREKVRHMDKIHVVLVGDVLHSGVARSMLWGLTVLGATVTLCAPPTLIGPVDFWLQTWPSLHISYDLADAIEGANVVMLLPAQQYDTAASSIPSLREYRTFFSLSSVSLDRVQHEILVLPSETINTDIEMTPEVANLLQPIIEEQATNGIAVRMALLYLLLAPSS